MKFVISFFVAFIAFCGSASAQSCNPNASWILQHGPVTIGNSIVYGPACGQFQDGGTPNTGVAFTPISGTNNQLNNANCQQILLWTGTYTNPSTSTPNVSFPTPGAGGAGCEMVLVNGNGSGGSPASVCIQGANPEMPFNFLSSSPPCSYLFPGQSLGVKSDAVSWQWRSYPGRWYVPTTITLNIDPSLGNDLNDGFATGVGRALKTVQRCVTLYETAFDHHNTQGTCLGVGSALYVENITAVFPPLGSNTLNINLQGSTLRNAGVGPTLLVGNEQNIQLSNTNLDNTGAACLPNCVSVQVHNHAVFETLQNVICGIHGANGVCIQSDPNTAGPHTINIDNGLIINGNGGPNTMLEVFKCFYNCTINFNGAWINTNSPQLTQLFELWQQSSATLQGNVTMVNGFGNTPRMASVQAGSSLINLSGLNPLTGTSAPTTGTFSNYCLSVGAAC